MENTKSRIFMAVCGVFTAVVIVLSQFYCFHEACDQTEVNEKTAQEESEGKKTGSHEAYFTMPSSTAPPSVSVQPDQEKSFICDILLNEEEDHSRPSLIFISLDKFFQTLLRVIISPNAP